MKYYDQLLKRLLVLFGLFLLAAPLGASAADNMTVGGWEPAAGDVFIVDVPSNMGYLVHEDGRAFPFTVATGRKAFVHYIGKYYNAETPLRTWKAQSRESTNDRYTFGVSGRFLRLYQDGNRTSYGIHSYYKVDEWMQQDERFLSMGCIIVTENILDVIEKTYTLNKKSLTIITTDDVEDELLSLMYTPKETFGPIAKK
ncbi:hypothetical protein EXS70_01835 [Candidatus Peribacteria bacterium]|nr:hypothetical protein [Candidatus Peribacteria bacterium]